MKVLAFNAYFHPEIAASIYLFDNIYKRLADEGIEVEVCCPVPTRGCSDVDKINYKKTKDYYFEKNPLIHVHRFSMIDEGKGTLQRFFRYLLTCFKYISYGIKRNDINVMFVESTPPILGATAAIIKKIIKKPLLYDLQDIFPDSLISTGILKKRGLVWKIGRLIENFTYKECDKIIVISDDFKKNLIEKGVPEDKISVIYNWVEQDNVIYIDRECNELFEQYGLDKNRFYVSYCGNIGLSQNIELLLEIAYSMKDIGFVFVGDGVFKKEAENIVKRLNLKNIVFIPFQPYEKISNVFSIGDVGIIISKPNVGSSCVPSKTWSIMSAGRPIIANFDENEVKSILTSRECGIFTKAGDKEALRQAILKLYTDKSLRERMGKNGRKYILDNFTKESGTNKYLKEIMDLCKKSIN